MSYLKHGRDFIPFILRWIVNIHFSRVISGEENTTLLFCILEMLLEFFIEAKFRWAGGEKSWGDSIIPQGFSYPPCSADRRATVTGEGRLRLRDMRC